MRRGYWFTLIAVVAALAVGFSGVANAAAPKPNSEALAVAAAVDSPPVDLSASSEPKGVGAAAYVAVAVVAPHVARAYGPEVARAYGHVGIARAVPVATAAGRAVAAGVKAGANAARRAASQAVSKVAGIWLAGTDSRVPSNANEAHSIEIIFDK